MNYWFILVTGFFLIPQKKKEKKKERKTKQANLLQNHTKQGIEDIQTFTRTQLKTLTALTHNIPHKSHTTLHSNQYAYGKMIKVG